MTKKQSRRSTLVRRQAWGGNAHSPLEAALSLISTGKHGQPQVCLAVVLEYLAAILEYLAAVL
jgi:hypothetical protein